MNDRQKLGVFLDFQEEQGGIMPVSAAAVYLRIKPQGVHSAIQRRKISACIWKGLTYCGTKSVNDYRWLYATKFADNKTSKLGYLLDSETGERKA